MNSSTVVATAAGAAPPTTLAVVKARQQGAWSSGDYAVVGTTLQIVGEQLCEALDLRSGQRVLDVAAGNGNASLAAALLRGTGRVRRVTHTATSAPTIKATRGAQRGSGRGNERGFECLPRAG